MISIIICARKKDIDPALRENILQTIGVPCEIVVIDNSSNQYSIFSAYNRGVSLSGFPYLLFMHDDIQYLTDDWGKKLVQHFADEQIGAVGVAGTPYLSFTTGAWWSGGAGFLYLLHPAEKNGEPVLQNYFPADSIAEEVVVLDGVWFSIRRSLFETIRFDEDTFHGFHFYDVDTTLQVFMAGYKLLCVRDILIQHLSAGVLNETWIENAQLFYQKWKGQLPVSARPFTSEQQCLMEYSVLKEYMHTELETSKRPKSRIYLSGISRLLRFRKNRTYPKTPVWAGKLLVKGLRAWVLGQ